MVLLFGGWGVSLAQTDTEHKAEQTLSDLKINLTGDPNVMVPEVYTAPPKIFEQIVGGKSEWKLAYFCRHHTSEVLRKIIHEQFATALFDKKGKETKLVDYTVSSSPATNQLIVRCPSQEDAQAVLEVLDAVDVAPIQVKIDCLISEVYADMTFDRETTIAVENLFGESIAMKPGRGRFRRRRSPVGAGGRFPSGIPRRLDTRGGAVQNGPQHRVPGAGCAGPLFHGFDRPARIARLPEDSYESDAYSGQRRDGQSRIDAEGSDRQDNNAFDAIGLSGDKDGI